MKAQKPLRKRTKPTMLHSTLWGWRLWESSGSITRTEFAEPMRTYQARFDVDYSLRTIRCLHAGDRIIPDRYATLYFVDGIQLLRLLRQAGMPEEIALGDNAKTTWTVTFQQLSLMGYTDEQLNGVGIYP